MIMMIDASLSLAFWYAMIVYSVEKSKLCMLLCD